MYLLCCTFPNSAKSVSCFRKPPCELRQDPVASKWFPNAVEAQSKLWISPVGTYVEAASDKRLGVNILFRNVGWLIAWCVEDGCMCRGVGFPSASVPICSLSARRALPLRSLISPPSWPDRAKTCYRQFCSFILFSVCWFTFLLPPISPLHVSVCFVFLYAKRKN